MASCRRSFALTASVTARGAATRQPRPAGTASSATGLPRRNDGAPTHGSGRMAFGVTRWTAIGMNSQLVRHGRRCRANQGAARQNGPSLREPDSREGGAALNEPIGRRPVLAGAAASSLLLARPARATELDPPSGPVRGVAADGVSAFLGLPYAAPPVGPLRYASPAPPRPAPRWAGRRPPSRPSAAAQHGSMSRRSRRPGTACSSTSGRPTRAAGVR